MVNFASYLGKAELETHEMLRTDFSDSAIGSTWTFDWFCQFRHRGTSVEDDEHSGYSSSGCTDRSMEEFAKLSVKTDKYYFVDHWQMRLLM